MKFEVGESRLVAVVEPWDHAAFGYPVVSLQDVLLTKCESANVVLARLAEWVDKEGIGLVSCRLPSSRLHEGMLLEEFGFRFIEMVINPKLELYRMDIVEPTLKVSRVQPYDLERVALAASDAFGSERFHVDPRTSSEAASMRYANWIRNSCQEANHVLLGAYDESDQLVAFFLVQSIERHAVDWRLTAVVPEFQGRGLGLRSWLAVMDYHQRSGVREVVTTIAVRNIRVLNLYTRLGARFGDLQSTYHYVPSGFQP